MNQQEQGIYEFGNFQLNIGKGVLLREREPVSLQWKTFELLCVLVKSNGNLIATNELMDKLWADTFVEENNLRQHISALRKALGENGNGNVFIETVPRRGYRFLPEVRIVDSPKQPTLSVSPNNLSTQQTTLIGRETEIVKIKNLLLREGVRLLTLTGVGGTGKTTLAQAIAREMLRDFKDGVFFIELAAVTNPELVASTIAQTLGVKETGGKPILEVLKEFLHEKQMLLVADNFEQILSAAPGLAELVKSAPELKILVTSRARLHLNAACEFVVPPLTVPESAAQISLDELAENESVRLFIERARAVNPNFSLSEENANSVAEICLRLDGLPLAIELAAARVRIIPPKSILEKLENRLKLLTGGARDLPARQQTVRGTVEWSYELLDEDEKRLFRRLAVFAGGFRFYAAEAVCGDFESSKDEINVLDGITSLVDKSLVIQKEQADGEPRFQMLEVVREYALESLEASGGADAIRRSHAAYFLALVEEAEPILQGAESIKWLDHLEEEHDNLRAALQWSLENDVEMAARLAAALRFFWIFHTHLTEGRKWMKKALEKSHHSPASVRAKLLNGLGVAARSQGNYETARAMHKESLVYGRAASANQEITLSLRGLGALAVRQEDFTQAKYYLEKTLAISRKLNNETEIAHTLSWLGNLRRAECDNVSARPLFAESLAIFRKLNNKEAISSNLKELGVVDFEEGNYDTARSYFTEGLDIVQQLQDKIGISYFLDGFAALAYQHGELYRATRLAGAAECLRESIGYEADSVDRRFRDLYLVQLHTAISQYDFTYLYEQGRKLKLEEAIKLALETVSTASVS